MEIHTHRFDMTDPFAQVKQRLAQARTVMKQLPPVQRRALLEAMQMQMQNAVPPPRSTDDTVVMTSVPVREWNGGHDAMPRYGTPLPVRRSRPRRAPMPLLLQWLVKAERLERRITRQWQRQSRTLQREMRLWLRDARRHHQQHRRR